MDEDFLESAQAAIKRELRQYLQSNPDNVENAANALVDDLIDDAIMGVVFEVDIQRKMPLHDISVTNTSDDEKETPEVPQGVDIFGNVNKSSECCTCPNCNRSIAASRFAPHLAKCMGMGRISSRIARTRIATNANKDNGGTSSCTVTDDEDDADWSAMVDKKGKKKKEKSNGKKVKHKVKNGTPAAPAPEPRESSSPGICYDGMSERDRRALLSQICGVISEHTKKVCTKSTRCPLHTDEQKKALRELYLTEEPSYENMHIDVDTCEEEGEITKESMARSWEAENSNTSSPYDSTSTCSSSSKKRDKSHKQKNKD